MIKNNNIENICKFLLELGIKESLLTKLNETQLVDIASFALDHINSNNLLKQVVQLISMEINDKKGAAFLVTHDIATPDQIKNLSAEQLKEITEEYKNTKDERIAISSVRKAVIGNQQIQFEIFDTTPNRRKNLNK